MRLKTPDTDLNKLSPDEDGNCPPYRRQPRVDAGDVTVVFDGLEDALVKLIESHGVILGCVAWLTNRRILEACAGKDAHFIVQKEDFLRPDSTKKDDLRALYRSLSPDGERFFYPGTVGNLSYCNDPHFEGVRCVGNHNTDRNPAFPRMHHKFCVVGDWVNEGDAPRLVLSRVWTGSFNFTHNAGRSIENAVILSAPAVVQAYYQEFGHVLALSEPLDWSTPWSSPEWRIGT